MPEDITFVSAMHKIEAQGYSWSQHHHPFYEFGMLESGKSDWVLEGNEALSFSPNDAILFAPGQGHYERSPEGRRVSYFFVCFRADDDHPLLSGLPLGNLISLAAQSEQVKGILQTIMTEQSHQYIGRDEFLCALVKQLLILTKRSACKGMQRETESELNQQQRGIAISAAKALINGPYTPGAVAEMASHFELSAPYFSSLFRRYHGVSPREYVQTQRISRAKKLLLDTNLRVKEIAFELDYNDDIHFCHHFKKATGQTPNQYRNSVLL